MRVEIASSNIFVSELDQKIQLARQKHLTGILSIKGDGHRWRLYFLAGQLVWASTRTHAKRRWCRQLLKHRPDLLKYGLSAYPDWTYSRLARLVVCKKFKREVFSDIVAGCISEVLFDLQQQGTLSLQQTGQALTYHITSKQACDFPFINLQNVRIWSQAEREWEDWEQTELTQIRPNDALVINNLALLEDLASPRLFKVLSTLVNGHQTLRDLALKTHQPLKPFTLAILPHLHNQALQLQPVGDTIAQTSSIQDDIAIQLAQTRIPKNARIVYVDNNQANSQQMGTIVEAAGYRYTNIADPIEVLKQLLLLRPKLIFLQLTMPVVNGYELCAQIRRMSEFQETPIVMVGSGSGMAERMRAKMVGASEFMSQPIKPKNVLKTLIMLGAI